MGSAVKKNEQEQINWQSLIERAQQSDSAALAELVEKTQQSLFRFFVYLCRDRFLAEDLCQETYVKAFQNLKKLKEAAKFQSWLFQMGRNHFIDHHRSQKKFSTLPEQEKRRENESVEASADQHFQVQESLAKLKEEERTVLILVDMEGRSYEEAAEIMGASESAIRSRLHRARQAFLTQYEKK